MGRGELSAGYNESKHVENFGGSRFMDRQIRATLTYGVTDRLEANVVYQSNQYDVGIGFVPPLQNSDLVTFGLKALLVTETPRRPAVAFAVRDIPNQDFDVAPLMGLHSGRKYFLLASKRVVEDRSTGRFVDIHAGIANSRLQSVSGLFGMELALTPVTSFVAEGMWDSPFVNFRGSYLNQAMTGTSNAAGRFIFDLGLRMYPDLIPGMVIDTGFVGDGSFEFSFGTSYVMRL